MPSKLSGRDLKALLAGGGARPARPWVDNPGPARTAGDVVEVDRTVNAVGYVGLGGDKVLIGWPFAGQRVTLRLDGKVLQVLNEQRVLQATLPSPLPPSACGRLQGGRPAGPPPQLPPPAEQIAERTVSNVGGFMVAGQRGSENSACCEPACLFLRRHLHSYQPAQARGTHRSSGGVCAKRLPSCKRSSV